MNRAATLVLLLIAAGALILRWPALDQRPFHTDESVHAIKFLGLWERGVYRYDPREYHGPSLYYATLPVAWLARAAGEAHPGERTLRLVPVAFGVALILLLPLLRDALGRSGVIGAAIFTALSPAFVFYSRYYIHELLLVLATLAGLGCGWRYWRTGRAGWAAGAGAALGLMDATKETFVFILAAAAPALVATILWERWVEPAPGANDGNPAEAPGILADWRSQARGKWRASHALLALGTAALVSVALFTSFFTNAAGPLDSLRTYLPWFARAGGASPHTHPWDFYLERLAWFHPAPGPVSTEALILGLGLVGWGAALAGRKPAGGCLRFLRFLGFYTLALTAIYTVIPYKTPWCALGFLHGFILLAGTGVAVMFQALHRTGPRVALLIVLTAATAQLGWQAWRNAVPLATDRRNPYVYAHTSKDLFRLVDQIRAIARTAPASGELLKVIAPGGDYWPLPWYLREFAARTGWYAELPKDPYAPMMVVGSKFEANLDEKSDKKWLMIGLFEHRPKVFFELYVAFDCWKTYLESRPKPPDDE